MNITMLLCHVIFMCAMFHTHKLYEVLEVTVLCVCVRTPPSLLIFPHSYFSQDSCLSFSLSTKHPSLSRQGVSQLLSFLPFLICSCLKSLLFISAYTFTRCLVDLYMSKGSWHPLSVSDWVYVACSVFPHILLQITGDHLFYVWVVFYDNTFHLSIHWLEHTLVLYLIYCKQYFSKHWK